LNTTFLSKKLIYILFSNSLCFYKYTQAFYDEHQPVNLFDGNISSFLRESYETRKYFVWAKFIVP